ncbi:MAG: hypothetical protein IIC35_03355 [Gemmatimonadetes bacterium]|nr:hypothetical protein [Gemmatimonadota bacterium]
MITSACASTVTRDSPFDGSATSDNRVDAPIRIEVRNLNFNDVTIWAIRQGQRIRLGRVTGKTDEIFRIDWNLALPISFSIDVVGGRACTTSRILVDRNARVWIQVPSNVGIQPCRVGRTA